jgi:hypothetical protein
LKHLRIISTAEDAEDSAEVRREIPPGLNNFSVPPTEKRKHYELRALALRDFAGVQAGEALDPFALAQFAKLLVVDFDQIKGLSDESRKHLLGAGTDEWSGGACSQPLPNGWRIVILNPAHGVHRNRATLMEEIAHVFLGHKPNRLAILSAGASEGARAPVARDYNKSDEEAAYAIGAAALIPYAALRQLVFEGRTAEQIARRFRVSCQLAEYRIKVTHLWQFYKGASASRAQHV